MKRVTTWLMMAAMLLMLGACSDDKPSKEKPGEPGQNNDNGNNGNGNNGDNQGTPLDEDEAKAYILIPVSPADQTVAVDAPSPVLRVLVYDKKMKPAKSIPVSWSLRDEDKAAGFAANAQLSSTNEQGIAEMKLKSPEAGGTAQLKASLSDSIFVTFQVVFTPLPTGNIEFHVTNDNRKPTATTFDYFILEHGYRYCQTLSPEAMAQFAAFKEGDVIGNLLAFSLNSGESVYKFDGRVRDSKYNVVVLGRAKPAGSEQPVVVSTACIESDPIKANETIQNYIAMERRIINPSGTYDTRSVYNIMGIIENLGKTGEWIGRISAGLNDPGAFIYRWAIEELILDQGCRNIIPPLLCKGIEIIADWGIKSKLQNWINGQIKDNPQICQVMSYGCMLKTTIERVELVGDMEVQALDTYSALNGNMNYHGFSIFWVGLKPNCQANDPDCGRYYFDLKNNQYAGQLTQLGLAKSSVDGFGDGDSAFAVKRHVIQINYGKIMNFFINNVIAKQINKNATDMKDAIRKSISCNGFPNVVFVDTAKWCRGAVNFMTDLLAFAFTIVEGKTLSSMILSGEASFDDPNLDFIVDGIVNGKWNGNMDLKTKNEDGVEITRHLGVKGLWVGFNKNVAECAYGAYNNPKEPNRKCNYPKFSVEGAFNQCICNK